MLEQRFVVSDSFVVADPSKDQIPIIMCKPFGILLPVSLLNRRIGISVVLQFNQHCRNIRLLGNEYQIGVTFARVQLRNNRIIIPG